MRLINLPDEVTYIAAFLTFACGFKCSYCINRHGNFKPRPSMSVGEWILGLNRLSLDRKFMVPITLQGGEPSKHSGFFEVINGINDNMFIDILTNLDFNIDRFIEEVKPERLKRDVPYASIRVSYHPEHNDLYLLIDKIKKLMNAGFDVGLFVVEHPGTAIEPIREKAEAAGIDFRVKEFLGWYEGVLWGQYHYPQGIHKHGWKDNDFMATPKMCRSTELLIAPDGFIHKCHSDLYAGIDPVAHLLDDDLKIEFLYRSCGRFGQCNPCDLKIKNNRFQEFGSCAVDIRQV